ncbi:SNF2-related protein [Helicobacter cetorum]|uniref:Uncharacterized protein n=1 Tax=Helicobacter cetorum (strain ATCC BAA-540 / CCUG 52418 / MIT 99-5656) TaxID=1163745 RepID=I0EUN4_HELCM|nr:SNF2-related protein [Helicobacter cetorum]AFI06653.1 hypothetical protein HCD_08355 [Helicobacter cetorum MIT 99-5656]
MAYKPSKKKLKELREQPNLFSILDDGDVINTSPYKQEITNTTLEPTIELENGLKSQELALESQQEPLNYQVKFKSNTLSMISRKPIEWAEYLSYEQRQYNDNSTEEVNFFANGEIKDSSRYHEINNEGFKKRITKEYKLINTETNQPLNPKETERLTYTNSLEQLKEQGLEIELTHHYETHKKVLENGNEITREYNHLKDIYKEVERTSNYKIVKEIVAPMSSAEYFKLYNRMLFESEKSVSLNEKIQAKESNGLENSSTILNKEYKNNHQEITELNHSIENPTKEQNTTNNNTALNNANTTLSTNLFNGLEIFGIIKQELQKAKETYQQTELSKRKSINIMPFVYQTSLYKTTQDINYIRSSFSLEGDMVGIIKKTLEHYIMNESMSLEHVESALNKVANTLEKIDQNTKDLRFSELNDIQKEAYENVGSELRVFNNIFDLFPDETLNQFVNDKVKPNDTLMDIVYSVQERARENYQLTLDNANTNNLAYQIVFNALKDHELTINTLKSMQENITPYLNSDGSYNNSRNNRRNLNTRTRNHFDKMGFNIEKEVIDSMFDELSDKLGNHLKTEIDKVFSYELNNQQELPTKKLEQNETTNNEVSNSLTPTPPNPMINEIKTAIEELEQVEKEFYSVDYKAQADALYKEMFENSQDLNTFQLTEMAKDIQNAKNNLLKQEQQKQEIAKLKEHYHKSLEKLQTRDSLSILNNPSDTMKEFLAKELGTPSTSNEFVKNLESLLWDIDICKRNFNSLLIDRNTLRDESLLRPLKAKASALNNPFLNHFYEINFDVMGADNLNPATPKDIITIPTMQEWYEFKNAVRLNGAYQPSLETKIDQLETLMREFCIKFYKEFSIDLINLNNPLNQPFKMVKTPLEQLQDLINNEPNKEALKEELTQKLNAIISNDFIINTFKRNIDITNMALDSFKKDMSRDFKNLYYDNKEFNALIAQSLSVIVGDLITANSLMDNKTIDNTIELDNTSNNTIEPNETIRNNITQNNDNNNPSLSIASLELEQQNLGEQNANNNDARIERDGTEVHRDLHTIRIPREAQERTQKEMGERIQEEISRQNFQDKDLALHNEPRETTSKGVLQPSDTRLVSRGTPLREHGEHDFLSSGGDRVSTRRAETSRREETSGHQNDVRGRETGNLSQDERRTPPLSQQEPNQSSQWNDMVSHGADDRTQELGLLRLSNPREMGALLQKDNEINGGRSSGVYINSDRGTNQDGARSPRQHAISNQESARDDRYGVTQRGSNQSVSLPIKERNYAEPSVERGLDSARESWHKETRLQANLDNLQGLLHSIKNNTIASEPDFRDRLLKAIKNNEPLKDSLVGQQLLKDPTTKVFYDKFNLKISTNKLLEILENRIEKSIEVTTESLNFNEVELNALERLQNAENTLKNNTELNDTQENNTTDNSLELNNTNSNNHTNNKTELNNANSNNTTELNTKENNQTQNNPIEQSSTPQNKLQEQETSNLTQELNAQELSQTSTPQQELVTQQVQENPKLDFKPSEEILIKGKVNRYKANIKAIELLKELQTREKALQGINDNLHYYATKEEQEILAKFSGWGGLESYFKQSSPNEYQELKTLLTRQEFDRAFLSTRDAYYTPKLVIDSIYVGLEQLGFNNDENKKEIFEPSLGTGKFLAYAPNNKNYHFVGAELDPISASISKFLYPNQRIENKALQNYNFYQDYDAFIGNPPYGQHKIHSSNDTELSGESIHNYFLGKAIKELKEDGIGAFVVSSWFMDSKNSSIREHIAQNATFLGAIRLPNSVFKGTGAEVTSDIVFFKKGVNKEIHQDFTHSKLYYEDLIKALNNYHTDLIETLQENKFDDLIDRAKLAVVNAIAHHFHLKPIKEEESSYNIEDTSSFGYSKEDYQIIKDFIDKVGENKIDLNEQTLNEYFANNPQNILGNLSLEKTRYSSNETGEQIYKHELQVIEDKSLDLEKAINKLIENLPKNVYAYHKPKIKTNALIIDRNDERYKEVSNLVKGLEVGELVYFDKRYYKLEQNNENAIFLAPTKIAGKTQEKRIAEYLKLKVALNDLTSAELNPLSSDLELESKRTKLNLVYEGFVKQFGYLNENRNRKDIRQDLYGAKVLGLERDFEKEITPKSAKAQNISPRQPSAKKAQIFFERTLNPKKEFSITNAKEALIASLNQKGRLDLHFIRDNFKSQSLETTIKELLEQKLIYKDHSDNGDYILANDYLSGNVKRKLKEVKEAVAQGIDGLEDNLKDLELIIPKDLKATEIMANINSPWIPTKYLEEFLVELSANHYKKQYGYTMNDAQIENIKKDINIYHSQGAFRVAVNGLHNGLNELFGIRDKVHTSYYKVPFSHLLAKVLNNKDLSVKYEKPHPTEPKKTIQVTDEELSNVARSKAEELKEAFKDWIYKDYERRTHLEKIYNDTFNNSVLKTYDGSNLELEGFNTNITLRPHQKNAIFRTIQDRVVCLDHQVGAGKTLCAISACMEQKRMGLVNKTLIAVPNHLTKQWGDEFYRAYPNANVLVVDSKDITENERELLYNQIANNNYDAVIIAHSHLNLLSNPIEIVEEMRQEELDNAYEIFERLENEYLADKKSRKKPSEKAFKNKIDRINKKYDEIIKKQGSHIDISQMGIDNLIVDEAHLFKNLAFETSMEKIAGLGNQQGSNRARDLFIKTRYLHKNNKKMMFLTGTPIANSLSEMYHLQRYLTPEILKERGLEYFDDWAKTYGEVVSDFELDTSAQNYKMVNRFSKFNDVQGLSTMYRQFADIVSNDDILKHNPHFVPKVYGGKPINVVVPRSEEVAEYIGIADENGKYNEGSIIDRMQKCEGKKNKKGEDNILSCTTDARKVALDYRLIDPSAEVEKEFSKSYAMAENIYQNYIETNAVKGTQLAFIGLSTPKVHSQKVSLEEVENTNELENKKAIDDTQELLESLSQYDENGKLITPNKKELENELDEKKAKSVDLDEELAKNCKFDVYSDVLRRLINLGIPQNEIAFIHDAKSEEQKQDLFKRVNRGEVRVLLGSPAKMGVGTNVQERLVAMHELDCPWRPDELLQMEGRGIRQGNILHANDPENFAMKIYRYATEKTYDSRMWQIIETKSKGIEQFRNAHKLGLNELEDFNMGSSNASEMKAEATGNPLIIEEVKLRAEIKSEEAKYKAFNKEHYFNEESLKSNTSKLDYLNKELEILLAIDKAKENKGNNAEIKLYDLKNETSKDYELIKAKVVEPLKENATMSEELEHKKLKEQNKKVGEQNKIVLDEVKKQFAKNMDTLFYNEEENFKVLEYRGFVVNAYKSKYEVEFTLSPKDNLEVVYSPSNPRNLTFINENETISVLDTSYNFCKDIKFDSFLKRLDNAITKLPEKVKECESSIANTQENVIKFTRLVEQKQDYPRLEYLQALKLDHRTLIDDLAKMSKHKDYKPVFNPKSKEVLKKMEIERRASLESEGKEMTELKNSNKEQEVKEDIKSDDEVRQHIEQVIEKVVKTSEKVCLEKDDTIKQDKRPIVSMPYNRFAPTNKQYSQESHLTI